MKTIIYKFAVVLVVVSMFSGLFNVDKSFAYFSDSATISGTIFSAGVLDFHLDPSSDFKPAPLSKGEATSTSITLMNDGTLGFQYTASTTDLTGDMDLCGFLTLQADLNGVSIYNGSLSGFYASAGNYTSPSAWNLVVTLPMGATDNLQDKTCNFKFTFNGWQEGLTSAQGFSDIEQVSASLSSGHWTETPPPALSGVVLNEFLPRPSGNQYGFDFGNDSSKAPQGEWIELYNNSTNAIDLNNWYIRDATMSGRVNILLNNTYDFSTHASSTVIAPKGWLVVYMNKAFLNNSGAETITLHDSSGISQDSYSYNSQADFCNLKPTEGETNDEKGSGIGGGCTDVPTNKSYARIPDGVGSWVDPVPTPGESNVAENNTPETGVATSKAPDLESSNEEVQNIETSDTTPEIIKDESTSQTSEEDDAASENSDQMPPTLSDPSGLPELPEKDAAVVPQEQEGSVTNESEPKQDVAADESEVDMAPPEPAVAEPVSVETSSTVEPPITSTE